jgi:hypothetical protein
MKTGQNIEAFIMNCIRESGVTLSLVSRNSLVSSWVTMETVNSNLDEKIRGRYFMPCYLDPAFLDRKFTPEAIDIILAELKEITDLMREALDKEYGIEDLQMERTRYLKMKGSIADNIGKLRDSLCIDLSPGNFEAGMKKVVADLRASQTQTDKAPAPARLDIAWDDLIEKIKKGNCAIFLGHGLISEQDGTPGYERHCETLGNTYADQCTYSSEENFFLFDKPKTRNTLTKRIREFYNNLQPDLELYQMLAEIPVSLYISISPDPFLENALGPVAQTAFYKDPQKLGMDAEATADDKHPLVYHIFGSTKDPNSLLLSHDDLFDFLKSALGGEIPTPVKYFFRDDDGANDDENGRQVVFLGFSFKKWYVRLLLRLFNLSKPDNLLSSTASLNMAPSADEKSFASENFQVEFVETGIHEFVRTLHAKCKDAKIKMRPLNPDTATAAIPADVALAAD